SVQLRSLDALLAFGRGFKFVLNNSSDYFGNSSGVVGNASCSGGSWIGGQEVANVLRNSSSYTSVLSKIKFNSSNGHLQSDYLEYYALHRCAGCGASSFLETGRYYPRNRSSRALFNSQQNWLIFPNTFIGFGNLSLNVCAIV
uniref:Spike protein n=1 Tax=Macrostomum lignano TaxID=282301 RepID=A0A1I8J8J8_9PLAT